MPVTTAYPKSVEDGLRKNGFFGLRREQRLVLSLEALDGVREKFGGDSDTALELVASTPTTEDDPPA